MTPTEKVESHARVTGADRTALAEKLWTRYQAGASIRVLAEETGRSFGFVHAVLKEVAAEKGEQLRGRGGARGGKA